MCWMEEGESMVRVAGSGSSGGDGVRGGVQERMADQRHQ